METTISWSGFNGDRFQILCNCLIYTLVSKRAKLYSAPGKDGGIDQCFIGTYADFTGKFRFQDKFRNAGKAADLSQLKRDVREDIRNHASDEDFIVYLTNVNLLPQEEAELEAIALDELGKIGREGLTKVLFWHHAVLQTMILTCPVIVNQFFSTGDAQLEPYLTYFKPLLSSTDLRYQLANQFIGRAEPLRQIHLFLNNPETTLIVSGPGNMGKTRLILQFFQEKIDADDDRLALVLKPDGLTASTFSSLLAYDRKLVILLDDAHKHLDILNMLKNEIDKLGGRVKLILTTRNNQLSLVRRAIAGIARQIAEIQLDRLSPLETMEVYRSLLPGQSEENLHFLRERSNGLPGVIVTECFHVLSTGDPYSLSADENFKEIVSETVDQAIQAVTAETSLPALSVRQTIQLIALIGPVKLGPQGLDNLAKLLTISPEDLQAIGRSLEKTGLIAFGETIAIRSDPVGDTILRKVYTSNPAWIKKYACHPLSIPYLENIVNNLGIHDTPDDPDTAFLTDLLKEYVIGVTSAEATEQSIESIFHTCMMLAFRLPDLSVTAIELFLTVWQDSNHHLRRKGLLESQSPLDRLRSLASGGLARLIHISTQDGAPGAYFPLFLRCVTVLDHPDLVHPCFGFTPYDFETSWPRSGVCCARQLYMTSVIGDYFVSDDPIEVAIALATFESLYVSDLIIREAFDRYTSTFMTGQFYIPDCPHVRQLRLRLIEGLIRYHRKHRHDPAPPDRWTEILARVFLFFYPRHGKIKSLYQTEELAAVTAYFSELLAGDATVGERALIARFLHFDEPEDVKSELLDDYYSIDDLLASGSVESRLELFLSSVNRYSARRNEQLRSLIAEFPNVSKFVDAVKRLLQNHDHLDVCALNDLANYMGQNHKLLAKDLYSFTVENAPEYIPCLSPIMDFLSDDEEVFFSIIEKIWNIGPNHKYDYSVIGMLLSHRRRTANRLNMRDLDYLAWAISHGSHTSRHSLGLHTHLYANLDADRTFSMLHDLSKHKDTLGYILHSMCEDQEFCLHHVKKVLPFFKHVIFQTGLNAIETRPAVRFIAEQEGQEALFMLITNETRARSDEGHFLRNSRIWFSEDYAEQCNLFYAFFRWIDGYPHPLTERISNDLLRFFLPVHPHQPAEVSQLEGLFGNLIDECCDPVHLKRLSHCIQGFYPYNTSTLSLQCRLTDKCMTLFPTNANPDELIGHHFIGNIETGKSGPVGYPFPQDIAKANLLREFLSGTTLSIPVGEVLRRSLAKVDADIANHDKPANWSY